MTGLNATVLENCFASGRANLRMLLYSQFMILIAPANVQPG